MPDYLYSAGRDMETERNNLLEVADALNVLWEGIEGEGFQPEGKFDAVAAKFFVLRLPQYLSLLNIITRDLDGVIERIGKISDDALEYSLKTRKQERVERSNGT